MSKPNIILLTLAVCFIFLIVACDEPPPPPKAPAPSVVTGKIIQSVIQKKPETPEKPEAIVKSDKKIELTPEKDQIPETDLKMEGSGADVQPVLEAEIEAEIEPVRQEKEHYDSQDKIDPFKPLIQAKSEAVAFFDKDPERILTPLEKIELSQIRLVAVIIMKNKRVAMVEEASGKGYEVGIGTYIGKNRGKVSEIKKSSIVITELVKNFKGKITEQTQEIKLHKIDNEE